MDCTFYVYILMFRLILSLSKFYQREPILKTFPRQQQLKTEKKKLLLKDLKQLRKTKLEDRKKVKEALTLLIERHRDQRTVRSAV